MLFLTVQQFFQFVDFFFRQLAVCLLYTSIEVPIRVSATYAIDKTQWEEIEQVVKKSDAFEEYMPGFTPKAEHNYGSVISEIMITAQPNDFSTVTIVQNASTGEVEVSRSYLFKEKMDEVLPLSLIHI